MKVVLVAGAGPNFMKVVPLLGAIDGPSALAEAQRIAGMLSMNSAKTCEKGAARC